MKVYLASRFSRKEEMAKKVEELHDLNIEVTSRWLFENAPGNAKLKDYDDAYLLNTATVDIEDIEKADTFVLFSESPDEAFVRGGRHWETGYAYARNKRIIIVGPKENIFHYFPECTVVDNWKAARKLLAEYRHAETRNQIRYRQAAYGSDSYTTVNVTGGRVYQGSPQI